MAKSEGKWHGNVRTIVEAPMDKVWSLVSQTKRLPEWIPTIERFSDLAGEEGVAGYTRLISGSMFPQTDVGGRSWVQERLLSMEPWMCSYVYEVEASNIEGLDGSINTLKLRDYGDKTTLVEWSFEVCPLEGAREESVVDLLGVLYKSYISRIEGALRNN